jgi:peptidoglycan hydrolase CwlO-like protein
MTRAIIAAVLVFILFSSYYTLSAQRKEIAALKKQVAQAEQKQREVESLSVQLWSMKNRLERAEENASNIYSQVKELRARVDGPQPGDGVPEVRK